MIRGEIVSEKFKTFQQMGGFFTKSMWVVRKAWEWGVWLNGYGSQKNLAPQKYSCNQRRSHPAHPTQLVRSAKEVAMEFYKDAFFGEIFLTPKRREQSKSDRSVFGNYFPLHTPYFRFSKKKKKKYTYTLQTTTQLSMFLANYQLCQCLPLNY